MTHDYVRCPTEPVSRKVILVVPGANSDIEMNHVRAIVRKAGKLGYHAIVVNPVVPPQTHLHDLDIIDYRDANALAQSVRVTKELFGDDAEIYAVGFSLGSNYLLHHLGNHVDCQNQCGIKAVVSISGAFDMPSTCVDIRSASWGLYDRYILTKFKGIFSAHRFKIQNDSPSLFNEGCASAKNLYEFESMTRARALNLNSAARLLRQVSCNVHVTKIRTPILVISAHDDVVTKTNRIPIDEMKRSPNILMALYERGGHCDFFFKKASRKRPGHSYNKEYMPVPTFAFFDQCSRLANQIK